MKMKMNDSSKRSGSALVLTLMVVALLMIVVLSFVVYVRMELREVATRQQLAVARAHAKLGMNLALSQLQIYAGPDQRITAPATTVYPGKDTTRGTGPMYDDAEMGYRSFARRSNERSYLNRVETYQVPAERDQWEQALRDWWNADRHPHWVGVFDSSLRVDRATNPVDAPAAQSAQRYEDGGQPRFGEPGRSQLPVWLVSGNERFRIDQQNDTAYPADYVTPETPLGDPATDPDVVEVVGAGSATDKSMSVDGLNGYVYVPRLAVTDTEGDRTGSYGYWVGDESVKANFVVHDPYASAAPGSVEYRNRLQAPQRIGWERMTGLESVGLDPNDPALLKLSSTAQIQHLAPDLGDAVRAGFHHLTSHSKSLLTDTALGGLKKDLTRYLEDGRGLSDSDPIPDASLYDPDDPRFRAWDGGNTGFPSNGSSPGLPTWGMVREWYDNTGSGSGAVTPNAQTAPVMTYIMFHAGLSYDPATREIHWHWAPALVMWNPFDVPLSSASYDVEVEVSPILWHFNVVNESPSLAELQTDSDAQWDMRPIGREVSPGVRQTVRSFRSPQTNPETGGNHWPVITHTNPIYQGGEFGTGPGQRSNPGAYNIGGKGPFTYDRSFSDGTTDAFGRLYYNLRLVPSLAGRAWDPDITQNPSTNADTSSDFEDEGSVHGSGGGDSGKNWGQGTRFAPMTSDYNNVDPADTRLRFRITGGFAPGESRIFSLSSPVEWDPVAAPAVPLRAGLESDFPGTLHFPVLEVVNGPASANGLRFFFGVLAQNRVAPRVRVTLGGQLLQETEHFAGEGAASAFIMGEALINQDWGEDDTDGDGVKNMEEDMPQFISRWRPLYDLDDFHDHIQPYVQNTGEQRSALFEWGQHYFTPLTSNGMGSSNSVFIFTPVFSRFNFSARAMDVHPLLDRIRTRYGTTNRNYLGNPEGLSKIELFDSYSKATSPKWDNDQYNGTRGYSLITYRERPGEDYTGLSELPVRLARRPDSNLLSLGQLQQINLSPYAWQPAFPIGNSWAGVYNDREAIAGIHSRQPGVSGTWAEGSIPRPPRTLANSMGQTLTGASKHGAPLGPIEVPANSLVDMSYLLNENVWDRYFLSTIPSSPDLDKPLANSRHLYQNSASNAPGELTGFDTAAAHVVNQGALNVNSTSVEAWKALLAAFRDLSLGDNPDETVPVARTLDPIGGAIEFTFSGISNDDIGASGSRKDYSKLLNGFRYLDDDMIETLAERIVDEVRLRGPFYSMSDFVNRRLDAPQGSGQSGSAWFEARTDGWDETSPYAGKNNFIDFIDTDYDPFIGLRGLTGALQRAIDLSGINGGVNHPDFGDGGTGAGNDTDRVFTPKIRNSLQGPVDTRNTHNDYLSGNGGIGGHSNTRPKHTTEPSKRGHVDTEHLAGAPAGEAGLLFQGAPGFITQGDLLAMLGPALTARGDTFLIRSYGDASGDSGEPGARAYLEAVVQRVVEPVDSDAADPYRPTSAFGRRFEVVSIRWLIPEEI